jgi:hypothetical protein
MRRVVLVRQRVRRALADGAMDKVRDRFGWAAVRHGPLAMGQLSSVPDAFRRLAEKIYEARGGRSRRHRSRRVS